MASNKCFQLVIQGRIPSFLLAGDPLESSNSVTNLDVVINTSLTAFKLSILKVDLKNHQGLLYLRRNLSKKVNEKVKTCLCNLLLLPSLTYGAQFIQVSRLDLQKLAKVQKKTELDNNFKLNHEEHLLRANLLHVSELNSLLFEFTGTEVLFVHHSNSA